MSEQDSGGHVLVTHEPGACMARRDGRTCMFCDGGLSACTVCGAFEGAWPDECPGQQMTVMESDAVYAGVLNYRGGSWHIGECCQIRRPVFDRDNYLREHGIDPVELARKQSAAQERAQAERRAREQEENHFWAELDRAYKTLGILIDHHGVRYHRDALRHLRQLALLYADQVGYKNRGAQAHGGD